MQSSTFQFVRAYLYHFLWVSTDLWDSRPFITFARFKCTRYKRVLNLVPDHARSKPRIKLLGWALAHHFPSSMLGDRSTSQNCKTVYGPNAKIQSKWQPEFSSLCAIRSRSSPGTWITNQNNPKAILYQQAWPKFQGTFSSVPFHRMAVAQSRHFCQLGEVYTMSMIFSCHQLSSVMILVYTSLGAWHLAARAACLKRPPE